VGFADGSMVGQIQMQRYSPHGQAYIEMRGAPTVEGSGDSNSFSVEQMSDANFKTFVYSASPATNAAAAA
jgi:hypothetical protein